MRRLACLLWLWAAMAPAAATAQDFTALARLDIARSGVVDAGDGLEVTLHLSQPVPWRVFALDAPRRLVLDFREVDWAGARPVALLNADRATGLRIGRFAPGWSRMVVDLDGPFAIATAEMSADDGTGATVVRVILDPVAPERYAALSGPPADAGDDDLWTPDRPQTGDTPAPRTRGTGLLVVAIDAGHGGVDPGAQRDGVTEAELMLPLALELAEAAARAGMVPVLTRAGDTFVPLQTRMTIAREAGADLFLSLHADALEGAQATGASIYTLDEAGEDQAGARLAERHGRGDLLAGLDLTGQDDTVATVLMDLARLETGPAGDRLADALVAGLEAAGAGVNTRPRREAVLAVLEAADFPSVLVEVGFLSNPRDRATLADPAGRARIIEGLVRGIEAWAADEAARAPLQRQ
ncbi:N-acetylmuramoyl-L-alanine amidase [Roseisalinus antarcticus]|uniref:N-acetylmuramoyl-L-alanine amidase n=1 Tax=Roseisalinus antarcticus TaxID=254357 RepID=A0A1Y5RJG3_9RHOB|nr:N-acetylmuramoyl-L-alanine amidase [Roseisalinus antarcticus]SLN17665.1 N-acetylmuramoyl-L-alanine amidase AmiA precursor [Roseisalinus antarcticus]